jgi:broad specificity phosphatase PhoE
VAGVVGQTVPGVLIALVPHMDAGDRAEWDGPQDERPLSNLGRKQAASLASLMSKWSGITALFASPAARAHETLEPLARQLGLEIETMPSLSERRPGESDAAMAQRGERALDEIRRGSPDGIVIAASHGDIVPATIDRIALRRRLRTPRLERHGQWFAVSIRADLSLDIELCEAPGFPQ